MAGKRRQALSKRLFRLSKEAILEIGGTVEAIRSRRIGMLHEDMKFAAYEAMHIWMTHEAESPEWGGLVLRLLSSGDSQAAGVIFGSPMLIVTNSALPGGDCCWQEYCGQG